MGEICCMQINNIYILILGGSKFKESRIQAVCDSWLKNFSNYFISCDGQLDSKINHQVVTEHNDWHSCPPKIFRGMDYVVKNNNRCEWLFIGDDDTFVNAVNLVMFTKFLNVKEEKMYGRDMTGNYPYNGTQIKYLSGGGGTLIPMHVAKKMISKAKKEKWFEWLCFPRQIPPKHEGDYPTAAGADTKLGWLGNQLGIEQVSYPHLFYPEGYKKYKHDPSNILQCITYHRQYGDKQKQLNDIVFKNLSKNKVSLEPPKVKAQEQQAKAKPTQSVGNSISNSYYINTEILLLHKKIERLEKQINKKLS